MIKHELVEKVADALGVTKADAGSAVDVTLAIIADALGGGDDVKLMRFGNFKVVSRPSRIGRNPTTGEKITIPARRVVKFKPSPELGSGLAHYPELLSA